MKYFQATGAGSYNRLYAHFVGIYDSFIKLASHLFITVSFLLLQRKKGLLYAVFLLLCYSPSAFAGSASMPQNLDSDFAHAMSLMQKRTHVDSAYRAFEAITARKDLENSRNKEVRAVLAQCWNWMGVINMTFYYSYEKALFCLQKAQEYSDGDETVTLLINLGHITNNYSQCIPTRENISRSLHYYQSAFHKAVQQKDWAECCLAFINCSDFGFQPWLLKSNENVIDSFRCIPSNLKLPVYQEALMLYRIMCHLERKQWHDATQVAWELTHYYIRTKAPHDLFVYSYSLRPMIDEASGTNDSLLLHSRQLLDLALKNNLPDYEIFACKMLAKGYQTAGKQILADRYRLRYLDLKDYMLLNNRLGDVRSSYLIYSLDKASERLNKVNARLRQRNVTLFVSFFTIVLILCLLILVWRKNQQLGQRNLKLFNDYSEMLERDSIRRKERNSNPTPTGDKNIIPAKYTYSTLTEEDKTTLKNKVDEVMSEAKYICDAHFSLNSLAMLCEESTKNISQVINEMFKCTFTVLLSENRIKEACKRIKETNIYDMFTIEAISQDVGFSSRGGFVRAFKRQTGMTPSEFISIAKEKRAKFSL